MNLGSQVGQYMTSGTIISDKRFLGNRMKKG